MKKALSFCLAACLLTVWWAGCVAPGTVPATAPASRQAQAGEASQTQQAAGAEVVRVFLPADRPALSEVIRLMADGQGYSVEIYTAGGLSYQAQLLEALQGQDAPCLFWVDGQEQLDAVLGTGVQPEDFTSTAATPALRALAAMVPQNLSLVATQEDIMAGFPLGYYGEGALVNLSMLAALLGTQDLETLRADLVGCSWQEWSLLITMLEDYLAQPRRLRITIGSGVYTTPRYRPSQAQQLRGIFAVATDLPEQYLQGALAATLAVPYASPQAWLAASGQEKAGALTPVLPSLFSWLDFETRHMTGANGTLSRGENFPQQSRLSLEQALELFTGGTALFLYSDTRTGQALAQTNGIRAADLALVPLKLPADGFAATGASSSAQSQSTASEAKKEEDATARATAAIEENNRLLGVRADGYLCINTGAAGKTQAEALLLRLFTSDEGTAAILGQLYLLPPGVPYPTEPLANQLSMALSAGGYYPVAVPPSVLAGSQSTIGEWVDSELMEKDEWTQQDEAAFETVVRSALGLPLQTQ